MNPLLLSMVWTATVIGTLLSHDAPGRALLAEAWRATGGIVAWPGTGRMARHWLGLGGSVVAGAVLWSALLVAGRRLLDWGRAEAGLPPPVRSAAAVLAGMALVATAGFGLGLAGLLLGPVELAATAVLGCAACAGAARWRGLRIRFPAGDPAVVALAATLAGGLALLAAVPETTIDALSYHLAAPEYFRAHHRIVDAPHLQYRWPLLTEQILSLLGGVVGPHLLNALVMIALALLVAGWLEARAGRRAAWLGAAAVLASGGLTCWVPIFKPDLLAGAFAVLAFVAWEAGRTGPGTRSAGWLLCGAALGWTACAKQSAVAVAGGLLAATALARAGTLRLFAIAAAAAVLAGVPWLARTWWITGNPAYPWGGGAGWNTAYGNYMISHVWSPGTPTPASVFELGRYLLDHVVSSYPLLLLGLPILVLFPGVRRGTGLLLVVAASSGGVWAVLWPYPRFMMAGFLLLCMASARGLAALPVWDGRQRFAAIAGLWLVTCLGLVPTLVILNYAGPVRKPILPVVLGLESSDDYRERTLGPYWHAGSFLAREAVPGDRVVVVGDTRGAGLALGHPVATQDDADLDLLAGIVRQSRTAGDIARRVRQTGATLIALNRLGSLKRSEFRRALGYGLGAGQMRIYAAWWAANATEVYCDPRGDRHNGRWTVYRISRRPARGSGWTCFLPGTEDWANPDLPSPIPDQVRRVELAVEAAPRIRSFHARLGELLARQGRWEAALPQLEASMKSPCAEDHAYVALIQVLERLGRNREAADVIRRGAARFPQNAALQSARTRLGGLD